jgi:hydrogenase assembly chaperone HypC/HupF
MCLAVVGKVESIDGGIGKVTIGEQTREVSFIALPSAASGDYVIVSLGMAMEVISEADAIEIDNAWQEIAELEKDSNK